MTSKVKVTSPPGSTTAGTLGVFTTVIAGATPLMSTEAVSDAVTAAPSSSVPETVTVLTCTSPALPDTDTVREQV